MSRILLSIKPEYVKKILSGEKLYEYRRVIPAKPVSSIVVYASAPWRRVVCEVKVELVLMHSVGRMWLVTGDEGGISRKGFGAYFEGCVVAYAFMLGKIAKFKPALFLSDFGVKHAPQNFVYLPDEVNVKAVVDDERLLGMCTRDDYEDSDWTWACDRFCEGCEFYEEVPFDE